MNLFKGKIMEKTKAFKRTIVSTIIFTFLLVIIIMSSGYIFLGNLKEKAKERYDNLMRINITIGSSSLELNNSFNYFDKYIKTRDKDYLNKYYISIEKVKNNVNSIESNPYINTECGIYIRNIKNMLEWYDEQIKILTEKDILEQSDYNKMMEVKSMYIHINSHLQKTAVSFLFYSNNTYNEILLNNKKVEKQIQRIVFLIIIISIIIVITVSLNIKNTMWQILKNIERLSNADWDIEDMKEQKYEELNILAEAFNKMKHSIKNYINEINEKAEIENKYNQEKIKNIEKDKILRDTQLRALKMQINPHFLFNALNTVSRSALFEPSENTVKLIEAISKILRYNLNSIDDFVELKEEINILKAYALIQETRFKDRMSFSFEIERNAENIRIPRMILQPLVENAISHGIDEKEDGGDIFVHAQEDNECIKITISDNGMGMNEDTIQKILKKQFKGISKKSSGLGISNILERLELYYRDRFSFNIESKLNEGTKISIILPIVRGDYFAENYDS